jgi:CheY-like chemotaxis protein
MSRSILVVEDYPDLRSAISELLSRNDCECDAVGSSDAIAKLAANHYAKILIGPRLSITDDPVLHYLIENQPGELEHVVVMVNPGRDEESTDERCHMLMKPFSRDELLAVVR